RPAAQHARSGPGRRPLRSSSFAKQRGRLPHLRLRRAYRQIKIDAIDHVAEPLEPALHVVVRQVGEDLVQESVDLGRQSPHPHLHEYIIRTYVRIVKELEGARTRW